MSMDTTMEEQNAQLGSGPPRLLVITEGTHSARALPEKGTITIGRAEDADIRLEDPMASRHHARLHVGDGFEVEDLGSANKTRIRDVALAKGEKVKLHAGEAFTIGSTILIVQRGSYMGGRLRRELTHGSFVPRLEEQCALSEAGRVPFALVRLHVEGESLPPRLSELLAPALRLPDVVGQYGPGEYEILLPATTPDLAAAFARDLIDRLKAHRIAARTGTAVYPRDGRTPDVLMSLACARVRGEEHGEAEAARPAVVLEPSPAMQRVLDLAERAAASKAKVLIVGETGVGKEVVAEAVHRLSPRASAPLVTLNCGAFPETLLEAELFGYEKGAFSGATQTKPGLLETAEGGTVFLDEIGELPLGLQPKLLRVLDNLEVKRIQALKTRKLDVRFLFATNRNLAAEVAAGRFRGDLYHRINTFVLEVPPLRDRRPEIRSLAASFVRFFSVQRGLPEPPDINAEASAALYAYDWPGNVRELRNVIEHAVVVCDGTQITIDDLPVE